MLDPYFSATKIRWLLDNVTGVRARAEAGALAFGTVDSFLIWRLTGGQRHVTDATNASRTLLYDLRAGALFGRAVRAVRRSARAAAGGRARRRASWARPAVCRGCPTGFPIAGVAGDQQAALYGQDCTEAGRRQVHLRDGRLPADEHRRRAAHVVARAADDRRLERWRPGPSRGTAYALEGSAFVAGALVQWLRDGLGIIAAAAEIEPLARSVPDSGGVTIVPALTGLGAPHWRSEARGLISGITRGTTRGHIARAALEAIALQNVDLVSAMQADAGRPINNLRVDGGAAANDLLMQIQADLLGVQIFRPEMVESTALGAAKLAALGVGLLAARRKAAKAEKPPGCGSSRRRCRLRRARRTWRGGPTSSSARSEKP